MRPHPAEAALCAAAGVCWLAQVFVPWTTRGALAESSPLDAGVLVRSGLVSSSVPESSSYLVLILPLAGAFMLVLAVTSVPSSIRMSSAVVAGAVSVVMLAFVTELHIDLFGLGSWLTVAATVSAAAAAATTFTHRPGRASMRGV